MARQASRPARSRWLLGLAVSTAAAALVGGCDTDAGRADKRVDENLQQATLDANGSADNQQRVHKDLDAAAKEAAASLPEQIRAKVLLAAAELTSADGLSRTAAANTLEIDRLCADIASLTRAVNADNQLVADLGRYQPQPVLDALKQQATAVAGSEDKPDWVKTQSDNLTATAATDKAVAALQGQVQQLQQQVKAETDQRNDLLAQADKFAQDAGREQHQRSVDLFVQGADARKQAADLGVKIDQDNDQLAQVQADLAVQMAEQDGLKSAGKGIDSRTSAVNDSWTAIGEQIKAIKAHSAAQMGDAFDVPPAGRGGTPMIPRTINAEAAELAAVVKRNKGVREEAETHYNAAADFYNDAMGLATRLKTQLGDATHLGSERQDRADREAWTDEKAALDPALYRFLRATAQVDLAEFHARAAGEARAVADLAAGVKPVLDTAGLTVPVGLDDPTGGAGTSAQSDQKLAVAGFKDATEGLTDVSEGSDVPPELKQGAIVQAMLAQYGWSLLASGAGDAQEAATHMATAKTDRDNAVNEGAPLPAILPTALALPAAAAPGAAPAMPAAAPAAR